MQVVSYSIIVSTCIINVLISRLILDDGGWMFVAGSSKNMPQQVRRALVSALATRLGDEGAEQWVERMEAASPPRYQTETWS